MTTKRTCPRCGAELAETADGLCPACLMKQGLAPGTEATAIPFAIFCKSAFYWLAWLLGLLAGFVLVRLTWNEVTGMQPHAGAGKEK